LQTKWRVLNPSAQLIVDSACSREVNMGRVTLAHVHGLALAATSLQSAPIPTRATPVELGAAPRHPDDELVHLN
jgi:hypothetical protein